MKNVQKLFSMAMLMCMAITMFSCSKDEEETIFAEADLMGEWTITQTEGDDDSFNFYRKESTYEFMADNKYTSEREYGQKFTMEGTWKLESGKTLVLTDEDGNEEKFAIKSLDSNKAILIFSGNPALPGGSTINVPGGAIEETFTIEKK